MTIQKRPEEGGRTGILSNEYATAGGIIRICTDDDIDAVSEIINDAAQAYRNIIPADRWKEPYMDKEELCSEIRDGVVFSGFEEEGKLLGVMGLQDKGEVCLIRHAYVRSALRRKGLGELLLRHLEGAAEKPILMGTWREAYWAVRFYEKYGYTLVDPAEKDRLLRTYWSIPERQVETSVVLADERWFRSAGKQPAR